MLLVITVICVIVFGLCLEKAAIFDEKHKYTTNGGLGAAISALCIGICAFVALIVCVCFACGLISINEKIEICQTQNAEIEESVTTITNQYLQHEDSTYQKLSEKDAINAVAVYPQLSSNSVINNQINIYNENNKQIKELKQQQADYRLCRGMACFWY